MTSHAHGTRSACSHYDIILIVTSFAIELAMPTVTDVWTYGHTDTLPHLIYKDHYDHLFKDLTDPKCATTLPVNRWHLSWLTVASGNFPVDSNLKKACPVESVFPDDQLSAPTRSRHVTIQLRRHTEKRSTTRVDIHRIHTWSIEYFIHPISF